MNNCVLKFEQYIINDVNFELNCEYEYKKGSQEINLGSQLFKRTTLNPQDHKRFMVELKVTIEDKPNEKGPFNLSIEIMGYFNVNYEIEDIDNDKMVNQNAVAILYPYLRAALSNITNICNIDPVILPVENVAQWFEDEKNKED